MDHHPFCHHHRGLCPLLWGADGWVPTRQRSAEAATVAGETVMTDEVGILYNRAGSRKGETEADIAASQAQALKGLVLLHLLAHQAQELGLRVSDEELRDYIKDPLRNAEYQVFYGNRGSFSGGYYKRYIENQLRVSRMRYEEFKRTELLAKKYLELVEMQVGTLPGEVEALDALRNRKANLKYVKLSPEELKGPDHPDPPGARGLHQGGCGGHQA